MTGSVLLGRRCLSELANDPPPSLRRNMFLGAMRMGRTSDVVLYRMPSGMSVSVGHAVYTAPKLDLQYSTALVFMDLRTVGLGPTERDASRLETHTGSLST